MRLGAAIGTMIEPGGGTAVGAVIGLGVGATVGYFICKKVDEKDKEICDKNLETDQDSCHERFGRGLRGSGFSSALSACLKHAEKRRDACYKGEADPGPFNGNSWPGGRNR